MNFISRGDYLFPFDFTFYWIKHFFVWSYQTGAANPDGIIRFPARLINFLVFDATNSLFMSYFYLFSSVAIIFVSFYVFATHFLDIKDRRIKMLASVFFACNPIFLGYLAKVGLVIGVAMLPLCLVVIKYAFLKRQFRYFVILLLLLNVSLIHPFTFTINLVVSGMYFLRLLSEHRTFISKHKGKVLGVLLVGFLINAYFILTIGSLGTVNKTVLSEEISDVPVDYAALVDFANTGNPLTALSLSRNVFLDFQYFNIAYEPIYFVAAFVFFGLLFGLYLKNEQDMTKRIRGTIVLLFALFLALLLLSMATFMDVNRLIKILITLPGGWMFRSPIKWQLYIPIVLGTIMCLLLTHTSRKLQKPAILGFAGALLFMSGFLVFDITKQLLVPRQFDQLAVLEKEDFNQKNLLLVNDGVCFEFLQRNPELVTELNQLMISRNVQMKRVRSANVRKVNMQAYDYVLGCRSTLNFPMRGQKDFRKKYTFANGFMEFYANQSPRPYIYTTSAPYTLPNVDNLGDKATFAKEQDTAFDFITQAHRSARTLQDPFEIIRLNNIQDDKVVTNILPSNNTAILHSSAPQAPTYHRLEKDRVTLSGRPEEELGPLPTMLKLDQFKDRGVTFAFMDTKRERQNLIPRSSFEEGLWQEKVWDCYAYDSKPVVMMDHIKQDGKDSPSSLELSARRHIACSGPGRIAVKQNARYLLHFAYKSIGGPFAGYQVTFDDPVHTSVSDYLPGKEKAWTDFSRELEVPPGAKHMQLVVYGRQGSAGTKGVARYDDFGLYEIPNLQGKYFVADDATNTPRAPKVRFTSSNPSQKAVTIEGAKDGFFLAMRDSYHPAWQLGAQKTGWLPWKSQPLPVEHIKANGFMNMWYIDPSELCKKQPAICRTKGDGTYDLKFDIEFEPQRWFYVGLVISMTTLAVIALYFITLGIILKAKGGSKLWRIG